MHSLASSLPTSQIVIFVGFDIIRAALLLVSYSTSHVKTGMPYVFPRSACRIYECTRRAAVYPIMDLYMYPRYD